MAFIYLLRQKPLYEQYAFGAVFFFLLITASYYLYAARATLILLHASNLKKLRNAVGLSMVFLTDAVIYILEKASPGVRWLHIGGMAWMLAFYAVLMLGVLWYEQEEIKRGVVNATNL